jgi:hypothetical protein
VDFFAISPEKNGHIMANVCTNIYVQYNTSENVSVLLFSLHVDIFIINLQLRVLQLIQFSI